MKCSGCKLQINVSELLRCVVCKITFHHQCLNMTTAFYKQHNLELKNKWQCESCENITSRRRRDGRDDTPVRRQFQPPAADMSCEDMEQSITETVVTECQPADLSLVKMSHIIDKHLESKLEQIQHNISKEVVDKLMSMFTALQVDFTKTTDFLSAQLTDLQKEVSEIKQRTSAIEAENAQLRLQINKPSVADSDDLREIITNLKTDLNDRDQAQLINDIELVGIPEFEGESCGHIALAVATKLGVSLEERDLVTATRVGGRRASRAGEEDSSPRPRPRPIVVRLARRSLRDNLIKSARVRRGASTVDLGLPLHEPKPLYINERLTKLNRTLFAKAREHARQQRWRFVWTAEGRVKVRRDETSTVHHIRAECYALLFFWYVT
ncbi:unnamed protein product [Plutella xylostella]|uniref:(diamondback moth) hypothetical protein n=1 Tax=Plutella xylostella TaxID=51655 RepID=A0A8S4D2X3_PLUXY|nr:unnamed protein product [Plutella xylostella]